MGTLSENQKFFIKVIIALMLAVAGWMASTFGTTWHASSLTPIAVAGLMTIIGSVVGGILGIQTPSAIAAVQTALLSGVHTLDEVKTIQKATAPGTVPTPEVAAAILGLPAPGSDIQRAPDLVTAPKP